MARVILTIEDSDDGESCEISAEFVPEVKRDAPLTGAQYLALELTRFATMVGRGEIVDAQGDE